MSSGSLPAHIRRAIRSGPTPKLREWRDLPTSQLTRAERNMAFVERYCVVPEGSLVGESVRLADFQEVFFRAVYDNAVLTTDAYLSIARKNSKTATIAMIALIHLVGPEAQLNAEIMSGARSREQAGQVYRYAEKMVQMSPDLREIVKPVPSKKKLRGLPRNTEYTASAAEASTTHGGSPVVAILDEVGQIKGPRDDFVDAVITSQGAHDNPLLLVISTQAPTDADLLSVWLDDAEKGDDPRIVSHVYEAKPECNLEAKAQWKAANPALGLFRSEKDMEKMAAKAARMPSFESTFRNLYLNQRVNTVSPIIPEGIWRKNSDEPLPIDPNIPCWAGLDLSMRTDLTALILLQEINSQWNMHCWFWAPEEGLRERAKDDRVPYDVWAKEGQLLTTPGKTVDYSFVAREMGEIFSGLDVRGIGFDRWRIDVLKRELENIGVELPMLPVGQGFKDMAPAVDSIEADLLNGRVRHGLHPVMTMCAMNAVSTKDAAGNRKLDKAKATGRIDGMVAYAMARFVAEAEEDQGPSVYEERGIITL